MTLSRPGLASPHPRRDADRGVPRFGVELELVGLDPRTAACVVADCLGSGPGARGRSWQVVSDRSVPDGFELRSPPLTYPELCALEAIVADLRRAGARCAADRAGMHVHVDARRLSAEQMGALSSLWAAVEPALRCLLAVHPRRSLHYCRPLGEPQWRAGERSTDDLRDAWSDRTVPGGETTERYRSLNFRSLREYGTVEFRIFTATTTAAALRACVTIALAFVARARDGRPANGAVAARTPATREEGLAAMQRVVALLQLAARERRCVLDFMRPNVMSAFGHPGHLRSEHVAFLTASGGVTGESYGAIVDQLLDARFFEEPSVRGSLKPGKPARGPVRAQTTSGAEAYSRAVIELLARSGFGSVRLGPAGIGPFESAVNLRTPPPHSSQPELPLLGHLPDAPEPDVRIHDRLHHPQRRQTGPAVRGPDKRPDRGRA